MNIHNEPLGLVVYFHRNPKTKEVFYVGRGSVQRAYTFGYRNDSWLAYVFKHGNPIIEIVHENMDIESSIEKESEYINKFGTIRDGNGCLVNRKVGRRPNNIKKDKKTPTPIKFDDDFKKAIQQFADKKEFGNISVVVKKAVAKYIKYEPKKDSE